jgi:hypothetical protein
LGVSAPPEARASLPFTGAGKFEHGTRIERISSELATMLGDCPELRYNGSPSWEKGREMGSMETTKQIPSQEWKKYFDRFTKRYLRDDRPEAVTIEVLSPSLGDQVEVQAAHLLGITFDTRSKALEILLENLDHLVYRPKRISVIEDEEGFIPSIEIVRDDDTKEVLTIRRAEGSRGTTSLTPRS